MEAKGLGAVCRRFRAHTQPPIGLQPPPGQPINGLTRQNAKPHNRARRVSLLLGPLPSPALPRQSRQSGCNKAFALFCLFAKATKVNESQQSNVITTTAAVHSAEPELPATANTTTSATTAHTIANPSWPTSLIARTTKRTLSPHHPPPPPVDPRRLPTPTPDSIPMSPAKQRCSRSWRALGRSMR